MPQEFPAAGYPLIYNHGFIPFLHHACYRQGSLTLKV